MDERGTGRGTEDGREEGLNPETRDSGLEDCTRGVQREA
jgi:hypothetical protein